MRIFITGGLGFIGKHLAKSLTKEGHQVTIFDNFSNSIKQEISRGIKVVKGDITNLEQICKVLNGHDVVIHLAAKISVDDSIRNPSDTFRVNVDGTKNILMSCKKKNIKKIILASSAAVYGEANSNDLKLNEESKTNPISPYGESKLKMEQVVKEFAEKNNINFIILRFFNIYGIGQSDEYAGVITKFREKILQIKDIEIFGDGFQTRDFVAIDDVVNSIHKSIEKINSKSGIYNIASGKKITIKELAKIIISISGNKIKIKYLPSKKGDIRYSQADISQAEKNLEYVPKIELRKGIKILLE